MKTSAIIEGLTILQKYRNEDGYDCGAEHDVLYTYATDMALELSDVSKMIELGWFQQDVEYNEDDEFTEECYSADEGWCCYP